MFNFSDCKVRKLAANLYICLTKPALHTQNRVAMFYIIINNTFKAN